MKRKNILNSFSNKEIAQIVIEELEKAGVKYSFGPGGVQFSGFQSTDGKATYYKKKYHFRRIIGDIFSTFKPLFLLFCNYSAGTVPHVFL